MLHRHSLGHPKANQAHSQLGQIDGYLSRYGLALFLCLCLLKLDTEGENGLTGITPTSIFNRHRGQNMELLDFVTLFNKLGFGFERERKITLSIIIDMSQLSAFICILHFRSVFNMASLCS